MTAATVLLDTHVWLWWVLGQDELSDRERNARDAARPEVVSVQAFDIGVILALDSLPASFHGDPADRIIVATARANGLPLATRDRNIRKSRVVRLWRA